MSPHSKAREVRNHKVPNRYNKSRSGVNRRNKSLVPAFIDSKCYRGQAVNRQTLTSDWFPIKTDTSGSNADVYDLIPLSLFPHTWKPWANLYEEYRFARVHVHIHNIQGTDTKGITSFYFDPEGNTTPSLPQTEVRYTKNIRNNNLNANGHQVTFTFREIEDLSYRPTVDMLTPFCATTFCSYTDSAVLDSPPSTQLYLIRFHVEVIFKNLRVLEA